MKEGIFFHHIGSYSSPLLRRGGVARESPPGWSRRDAKMLRYFRQYTFKICNHVTVLEAQYADSSAGKEIISSAITRLRGIVVVRGAVEFDRHAFARAEKIQRVRTHAMLAAELSACELTSLQVPPQYRFCGRHSPAELPAKPGRLWKVV